jgi:hypothetical protein
MKPAKKPTKLVLRRDVVAVLTRAQLADIVGGSTNCSMSREDICVDGGG